MKNSLIIILVAVSFILGFFVSKFYFQTKTSETTRLSDALGSGVYNDLYFESLRKEGDSYYVKFSKQLEDRKLPAKCYSADGGIISNEEYGDCFKQGRPLDTKLLPDIDLSKEYKFADKGIVGLLIYSEDYKWVVGELTMDEFYDLINKTIKTDINYYGGVINEPQKWGFEVVMINGEIENMSQIYQE